MSGYCGSIADIILLNDKVRISQSNGLGVEGTYLNYSCMPGLSPRQEMASVCSSNGEWQPHPSTLECTGT